MSSRWLADGHLADPLPAQSLQRAVRVGSPVSVCGPIPDRLGGRPQRRRGGTAVILPRSFERGQTLYDWRHYVSLLQRKPGALRNGAPFKTMPEPPRIFRLICCVTQVVIA